MPPWLLALLVFAATVGLVIRRPGNVHEAVPALAGAAVLYAAGLVGWPDLVRVAGVVGNAALTIVGTFLMASVLEASGFFRWAAARLVERSGGSGHRLFFLVLAFAFCMTLFLNNDGSILIATPIVLQLVRDLGLEGRAALGYLIGTALVATATSAPIGVSNMANLEAMALLGLTLLEHTEYIFFPALLGIGACAWIVYQMFRAHLPAQVGVARAPGAGTAAAADAAGAAGGTPAPATGGPAPPPPPPGPRRRPPGPPRPPGPAGHGGPPGAPRPAHAGAPGRPGSGHRPGAGPGATAAASDPGPAPEPAPVAGPGAPGVAPGPPGPASGPGLAAVPLPDPEFVGFAVAVVVVVRFAFFVGDLYHVPAAWIAMAGALVLLAGCVARGLGNPWAMVRAAPWPVLGFALGMELVVFGLRNAGIIGMLTRWLGPWIRSGLVPAVLVPSHLTGFLAALMNNHPALIVATLMLAGVQGLSRHLLDVAYAGLVLGSDLASLVTPVGTLASLMWMHLVQKKGYPFGWRDYMQVTAVAIPVSFWLSLAGLYLVGLAAGH